MQSRKLHDLCRIAGVFLPEPGYVVDMETIPPYYIPDSSKGSYHCDFLKRTNDWITVSFEVNKPDSAPLVSRLSFMLKEPYCSHKFADGTLEIQPIELTIDNTFIPLTPGADSLPPETARLFYYKKMIDDGRPPLARKAFNATILRITPERLQQSRVAHLRPVK